MKQELVLVVVVVVVLLHVDFAAALRGMSRTSGDMSRRAFLILSICQLKYPSWDTDLFNGALMIAVKLNSASVTSFMYVFVLMCLYYYLGLKGLHRIL